MVSVLILVVIAVVEVLLPHRPQRVRTAQRLLDLSRTLLPCRRGNPPRGHPQSLGRSGRWDERRQVLSDGLQKLDADLIAFQEAEKINDPADGGLSLWTSEITTDRVRSVDREPGRSLGLATGWQSMIADCRIAVPEPFGRVLFVSHKPSWKWPLEHERERQAVTTASSRSRAPASATKMRGRRSTGAIPATPLRRSIRLPRRRAT